MLEKPKATHTLGLDFTGDSIRFAAISEKRGEATLEKLFEVPVETEDGNVKPLYTKEKQTTVKELLAEHLPVTALSTQETLVRPLEMPLKKTSAIDAALLFQAEPLLPYSSEDAIIDRVLVDTQKERTQLTITATKKDYLSNHLSFWNTLNVEPEIVSCIPQAITSFVGEQEHPCIAIHVGHFETSTVLIKSGKLIAANSLTKGTKHLQEALKEDTPDADSKALKSLDLTSDALNSTPQFHKRLESYLLEITRLVLSHSKTLKGEEVNHILVTGDGAALMKFDETLSQHLNKQLIEPNPKISSTLSLSKLRIFAASIGMALTAALPAEDQVNFRQNNYSYPHPWKRMQKPLLAYFALTLLLSLSIYLFANSYANYRLDRLKEHYSELLGYLKKPHSQFENTFHAKKTSGIQLDEVGVITIKEIDEKGLGERINFLHKQVEEVPNTFPLLPQTPRVSDLLLWLSHHDVILGNQSDEQKDPRILLDKLSYKMVKRPDKSKPDTRYQVRVEMEFTSTSPRYAREFHDALLEQNPIVDPKQEVKWVANRGKYKASFILKDKTLYNL